MEERGKIIHCVGPTTRITSLILWEFPWQQGEHEGERREKRHREGQPRTSCCPQEKNIWQLKGLLELKFTIAHAEPMNRVNWMLRNLHMKKTESG